MPTLVAPDGTRYETDNEDEIRNLTLGHGYRVLDDGEVSSDPANEGEPDDADGEGDLAR